MKPILPLAAFSLAVLLLMPRISGAAGDEHGHDHGDSAPSAGRAALPRFAAVSDVFELVGVLNGKQITLYLDRAADNSPVTEAQIELDIAGQKFKAQKQGADEFEVVLTEAPKPGVLPITATVSAGKDTDLLAGELDIHEAAHSEAAPHAPSWKELAGWAAVGIAALALLAFLGRRLLASRQPGTGAVA